jgi:hypothetical protein
MTTVRLLTTNLHRVVDAEGNPICSGCDKCKVHARELSRSFHDTWEKLAWTLMEEEEDHDLQK